jgi:hypothetical protein
VDKARGQITEKYLTITGGTMEPQKIQELVLKMDARIERNKESIDKLEAIADRTDAAIRKIAEQQAKQVWIMTTAGIFIAASQTGLLANLGKLFVLAP